MQRLNNMIDDSDSDEEIIPRRPRWLKERKDLFEYYDDHDFAMRFRLSKEALFLLLKIERNLEYISDRAYRCESAIYNRTPGLTFHQFPKDESTWNAWLKYMKFQDWQPNTYCV
ncbi:hypothetical protein evm_004163 [Chilo suppressalis]|nr:hypothetical protein evm_004163 [Chilo suppressalis]